MIAGVLLRDRGRRRGLEVFGGRLVVRLCGWRERSGRVGDKKRNRGGDVRSRGAEIFAEGSGERRGDLSLCNRLVVRALPEGGRRGSDGGDPDVFGAGDVLVVVTPVGSVAAAVVSGDDEGGSVAIVGRGLKETPQVAHPEIGMPCGAEVFVVATGVAPFVGFAEGEVEGARFVCVDVFECGVEDDGVEGFVGPGGRDLVSELVEERLFARNGRNRDGVDAGVNVEAAALVIEYVGDDIPSSESGDAAVEPWAAVEPFEDGDVRIEDFSVAVDARIVETDEHFAVTGIGEFEAVGDAGDAAEVLIADELAVLGDRVPEEGHERLASVRRGISPEGRLERSDVFDAVVLVHQSLICAGEDFLPAESVDENEEGVSSEVGGTGRAAGGERERGGEDRGEKSHAGDFL